MRVIMTFFSTHSALYLLFYLICLMKCDNIEETEETPSLSSIRKCVCPAGSVRYYNECVQNATFVDVVSDVSSKLSFQISTSDAENVSVSELVCSLNYFRLNFTKEKWTFLPSGQLFQADLALIFDESKYCVEHYFDEDEIEMEVSACVSIPSVPRCCPNGKFDDSLNACLEPNREIVVSVSFGKIHYKMTLSSFANNVICRGDQNRTTVKLGDENLGFSHLKLNNEGLFLSLAQPRDAVRSVLSRDFCLSEHESEMSATYCQSDPLSIHLSECSNAICVRKCCPEGQGYDMMNYQCADLNKKPQWKPTFYDAIDNGEREEYDVDYKTVYGYPICSNFFPISYNNIPPDIYRLLSNGSLFFEHYDSSLVSYQYCIDNFLYGEQFFEEAMTCFIKTEESTSNSCKLVESHIYPILLTISCVFLFVTLMVYGTVPELHAKVNGKCLISNVSSLFVAYLALIVATLSSESMSMPVCVAFGVVTQYTLLSSFFWLNVMCFDIWRSLRSLRTGRNSPANNRRRFCLYSLYAWGCPLIISGGTLLMHFLPRKTYPELIRPGFGVTRCFFPLYDKKALWIYLYGFILVILVVNTLFFVHLAWILLRAQKTSENALGKHKQTTYWAKLYLKLFLIMGVTWMFEAASWIGGSCGFWIATDIVNALRGLLIFLCFVCKKEVFMKLRAKSSPTFIAMRTTIRQGSTFFTRSNSSNKQRTSTCYVGTNSSQGTGEDPNMVDATTPDVVM